MQLFSNHSRGEIIRTLAAFKHWKGTRRGFKVSIELSAQPDFEQNRVSWTLRKPGQDEEQGKATHPSAALDQIEAIARRRSP